MYGYTQEEDRRKDPARQDAPIPERPSVDGLRWPSDEGPTTEVEEPSEAASKATPAGHVRWLLEKEQMHPHDAAMFVMAASVSFDQVVEELVRDEEFNIDDWDVSPYTIAVMMACSLDVLHRVLCTRVSWEEILKGAESEATPVVASSSASESIKSCLMRVIAEVEGSAQPLLDALFKKWHPTLSENFKITNGDAIGSTLRIQASYQVKGANGNDGGKKVRAAAESVGVTIVSLRNWSITDPTESWPTLPVTA